MEDNNKTLFGCLRCGLKSTKNGMRTHLNRKTICEAKFENLTKEECFKKLFNEEISKPKNVNLEIKQKTIKPNNIRPNTVPNSTNNIRNNNTSSSSNIRPNNTSTTSNTTTNSTNNTTTNSTNQHFNSSFFNAIKQSMSGGNNSSSNNNVTNTHVNKVRNITKNNNYMLYNATGRNLDQNDINNIVDSIVQNELSILNTGGKSLQEDSDDEDEPVDDSCNCKLCNDLLIDPFDGTNSYFSDEIIEINRKLQVNKYYKGLN